MNDQWFMRRLREELGQTQSFVAKASGNDLTHPDISGMEVHGFKPSDEILKSVMKVFIARSAVLFLKKLNHDSLRTIEKTILDSLTL